MLGGCSSCRLFIKIASLFPLSINFVESLDLYKVWFVQIETILLYCSFVSLDTVAVKYPLPKMSQVKNCLLT